VKIILVLTDSRRKSLVFVTDELEAISLEAYIRSVIEGWRKYIDLTHKQAILATLYSLYKKPHNKPEPSDRGLQIASEFYEFAKEWLK